jgi:hypothetical protein
MFRWISVKEDLIPNGYPLTNGWISVGYPRISNGYAANRIKKTLHNIFEFYFRTFNKFEANQVPLNFRPNTVTFDSIRVEDERAKLRVICS